MRAAVIVEADPVADGACCVLDAVKAVAMHALLLERPDHTLDHAVLLRAMGRDELLLQPVAADECCELAAGKNQAVVRSQQELLRDPAQGAEPGDQGMFQRTGCCRGLARARQMPAQQLAGVAIDDQGQRGCSVTRGFAVNDTKSCSRRVLWFRSRSVTRRSLSDP